MKKGILAAIISTLSIVPLSSCDGEFLVAPSYHLEVKGSRNLSPNLPRSGNYRAGHVFKFKVEMVTDVSFNPWLNNDRLLSTDQRDMYEYYTFRMPNFDSTLTLTSEHFFVDREYSFSEVCWGIEYLNKETVTGIEMKNTRYISYDEREVTTVYSDDIRDIEYNIDILNQPLVKADPDLVPNSGLWHEIRYLRGEEDRAYWFEMFEGFVFWKDWGSSQLFKIAGDNPRLPKLEYAVEK
ncbi:MAG: hypothetical protein MJ220_02870 [Bacilli bacterium]|nr:hypothetical protein [Bacilli bacterium]